MMNPPFVHIVDDDPGLGHWASYILEEAEIPFRCYSAAGAFLDREVAEPGCLLLDNYMPGMNGLELLEALLEREGHFPTVMMSGAADVDSAVKAMKLGANDFLEKPFGAEELLTALSSAWDRKRIGEGNFVPARPSRIAVLTGREREVLQAIIGGHANREIAEHLKISPRTVEMHRARMMKRLQVGSLAEAICVAADESLPPLRIESSLVA